jgi:hypothetical protein
MEDAVERLGHSRNRKDVAAAYLSKRGAQKAAPPQRPRPARLWRRQPVGAQPAPGGKLEGPARGGGGNEGWRSLGGWRRAAANASALR